MIDQIASILDSAQSFLTYIAGTQFIRDFKWLAGILSLIFGSLVIMVIIKLQVFDKVLKTVGNFLMTSAFPKKHLSKAWQKILSRLSKNDEANLRLALMEADNFFDDLLKQMKLPGESMADRLNYLDPSQISNLEEISQAHKLRDLIVFNPEYPITRNEIEFGVQAYDKALRELGLID